MVEQRPAAGAMQRLRALPRRTRWMLVVLCGLGFVGSMLLVLAPAAWMKVLGGIGLAVLTPALVYVRWSLGSCAGDGEPVRAVERRYMREFVPAITAYMLLVLLSGTLLHHTTATAWRALLSLLPVLPIALVVRAMVRYVTGSDELEQRTHLQALAVAASVVGMGTITLGFLAAAHVLHFGGEAMLWVFPVMMAVYGVTRMVVARRYRGE